MPPVLVRAARTPLSCVALFLTAAPLTAQSAADRPPPAASVYVEAAGSALYYSVNVDRAFLRAPIRPFVRLGGMWIPGTFSPTWGVMTGAGVRLGRRPALELGGLRVFGEADDEDFPPGWSLVGALRLPAGRWVARLGASWLVSDRTTLGDREVRLWPLASFGITF